MKSAVSDLVLRMTGGNAAVAEICAMAVAGVEEGDVCRRVSEDELKSLAAEPSVAQIVGAGAEGADGETPFVVCGDLLIDGGWRRGGQCLPARGRGGGDAAVRRAVRRLFR